MIQMQKMHTLALKLVLISILILSVFNLPGLAEDEGKIHVIIDGQQIVFDVDPVIIQDRTMVPFRKIFEIYGFKVDWSESTSTVFANKDDQIIVLQINNNRAFVNNTQVTMDVPAQLINDRTMVPLRFVSENIGAKVDWVEETNTVVITSPAQ